MNHPLKQAALILGAEKETAGIARMASICAVTYQAAKKWVERGQLPRTDWTGETDYATKIAAALDGRIPRDALLTRAQIEKVAA